MPRPTIDRDRLRALRALLRAAFGPDQVQVLTVTDHAHHKRGGR